eukprot:TRINITY_DN19075_c0_g2_i2.p1 TRINITY_DN19075_c0_g2~~TRINITY_DN19075_c0_g2_i2.p1  ORF type:complete len:194 (+),score=33.05 TRINITY_DN19075_c0_g2_i2:64-645(+)
MIHLLARLLRFLRTSTRSFLAVLILVLASLLRASSYRNYREDEYWYYLEFSFKDEFSFEVEKHCYDMHVKFVSEAELRNGGGSAVAVLSAENCGSDPEKTKTCNLFSWGCHDFVGLDRNKEKGEANFFENGKFNYPAPYTRYEYTEGSLGECCAKKKAEEEQNAAQATAEPTMANATQAPEPTGDGGSGCLVM